MNRWLDGAVSLSTPCRWEAKYSSQYNDEAIGLGTNSGRCKRFLSLPKCPDQLWASPSLILGTRTLSQRWSIHSTTLTSWLHVMSSLRRVKLLLLMDRDNNNQPPEDVNIAPKMSSIWNTPHRI
jgi:hypothetical protein